MNQGDTSFSTADLPLARRIEAAEAANGFAFGRAMAQAGAIAEPFLGGCALFAGVGSPATHALGIGMNGPVMADEFDRLEAFFRERGSPVLIDLCPMADISLLQLVFERGYKVIEFNNLLIRTVTAEDAALEPPAGVSLVEDKADLNVWNRTVARGFQERDDIDDSFVTMLEGGNAIARCFLARQGAEPAGGGAMGVHNGIAAFYGDSTVLRARRRGVQSALIQARLRHAALAGCTLAMVCVLPGSGSHRNYERAGFRLFFMRVNLSRE